GWAAGSSHRVDARGPACGLSRFSAVSAITGRPEQPNQASAENLARQAWRSVWSVKSVKFHCYPQHPSDPTPGRGKARIWGVGTEWNFTYFHDPTDLLILAFIEIIRIIRPRPAAPRRRTDLAGIIRPWRR